MCLSKFQHNWNIDSFENKLNYRRNVSLREYVWIVSRFSVHLFILKSLLTGNLFLDKLYITLTIVLIQGVHFHIFQVNSFEIIITVDLKNLIRIRMTTLLIMLIFWMQTTVLIVDNLPFSAILHTSCLLLHNRKQRLYYYTKPC